MRATSPQSIVRLFISVHAPLKRLSALFVLADNRFPIELLPGEFLRFLVCAITLQRRYRGSLGNRVEFALRQRAHSSKLLKTLGQSLCVTSFPCEFLKSRYSGSHYISKAFAGEILAKHCSGWTAPSLQISSASRSEECSSPQSKRPPDRSNPAYADNRCPSPDDPRPPDPAPCSTCKG